MKNLLLSVAGVAALATLALAAPLVSGLNPGESVTPFHPRHVVGPLANTNNCFPCTFGNRPQVQVWVNGDSDQNVKQLARTLAGAMGTHKGKEFKALVVFVTSNPGDGKLPLTLKKVAAETKSANVGMAIVGTDDEAIRAYKINLDPSVKNTVLVYKNWQVAEKMVNFKADAAGVAALSGAVARIAK
jgi:hypothetical protein